MIRAFIQARMSSARFPGKVLAPFRGQPLVAHVIQQLSQVLPEAHIVVATSMEPSDDPLAVYVRSLGIATYRGSLNNVLARFQGCLDEYPCQWFVRISADSPLLSSRVLRRVLQPCTDPGAAAGADLITNVQPRTFPKGQSIEILNAVTFANVPAERLTQEEQEHLTKVYYNQPEQFKVINIASPDPALAQTNLTIDTIEDLYRLEKLTQDGGQWQDLLAAMTGPNI